MTVPDLAEQNLRLAESEERYRAVIDNSSDMIQSLRPDGTFEFVNQAWLDKLGYTRDDLDALIVWDVIHDTSLNHCQMLFAQAISGKPIPYLELTFKAKDGQAVPVEGSATSRFVGDEVVATHGFFRDISERLRAQELEERNKQLEREQQARYLEKMAALGKLSAGLAHELNNPSAAVQRAGSRLLEGMEHRDAATRELIALNLNADQWHNIQALLNEAPSGDSSNEGGPGPLELDELESAMEDWLDDHDIDRAWDIAPGLVQAGYTEDRLEEFGESLPSSAVSHAISLLHETLSVQESANIIRRSSQRISELVNAVKGYSYMDRASEQTVDLHEGLDSTMVILAHRLRDVTVRREYDRTIPKIDVFGNTLNQVWTNIVDNAIDATDGKGSLTLRTYRDDDRAVVEIEDNGGGIAPEDQACIFEPFFTTKPQGQGTGLGLDTAWRIVTEEHRGTITVESEPGRTVFRVSVPFSRNR